MNLEAIRQADEFARHRVYTIAGASLPVMEHPDGVYIGLPEIDYLTDWALSYSAFKLINSSPPDWHWDSPFNLISVKDEKDTPALRFGSALHCALLEPPGTLEKRFGVAPVIDDYPNAVRTADQAKARLREIGGKTSGLKPELMARLRELDPDVQIFDDILAKWRSQGKVELSAGDFDKIKLMVALATKHPDLVKAFTGVGLSEVSVFWTDENGVRQRARFDRLKPVASIDLKSFSNWQGRDFKKALLREAALRFYDVQAAHYDEGRRQARRLVSEGKVYVCSEQLVGIGEDGQYAWDPDAPVSGGQLLLNDQRPAGTQRAWFTFEADEKGEIHGRGRHLANEAQASITSIRPPTEAEMELVSKVFSPESWEWVWIFYKTDGAPTAQPVRLTRDSKAFARGVERRETALGHYLHYREIFGLEQMWIRMDPMFTPDESDWPFFMGPDDA
ncbi:nucleic acid-binding protein [Caulobacter phage Sansa]|uniref:Nucleic acid-binding protein n=1 Tax=Caulobacter phage Sansa TaxID=1675600 RepID=A0A0K1LMW8_9CAUD|nr:exonuclease VIII [Caulobacter phage Sansa]AKU43470.1 nucleic acid-binding protein [Caulobacter phage Sansa]